MTDKTSRERSLANLRPFQPGNPGRPKGSRNKLGEEFVAALQADFNEHGKAAIATVRAEKPDAYLKVIAQVVPKELLVRDMSLEDLSDDDLIELLAAVRSATVAGGREAADGGVAAPQANVRAGSKSH